MATREEFLDARRRNHAQTSTGWKDVTLRIYGSDEEVTIPVMVSAKVLDLKHLVAEMHEGVSPSQIDFVFKVGPSWKKQRNGDEVQTRVMVKGIKSFKAGDYPWSHPYLVIGAGYMGLRQGMHYTRHRKDYVLVDKRPELGGNAWIGLANATSKLQSEGVHYQLHYDPLDGSTQALLDTERFGHWPSKAEILVHWRETVQKWGVWPQIRFNCEVTEMRIVGPGGRDPNSKSYEFVWRSSCGGRGDEPGSAAGDTGTVTASCLGFFPGALVTPHRKTWPGEDAFGGQIGYGFSEDFNYSKVHGQDAIIIGMGAYSHENNRTFLEFGGRQAFIVARHFNLMLPRFICWWINQSTTAPTAAMVLWALRNAYDVIGMDPWDCFSVIANPERTVASIKQYTRWGITDVTFLAMYFGKTRIIHSEVKRFKVRAAVLTNGEVLEDVDHVIKVIGFDADFGVDQVMQCTHCVGYWPSGDYRRVVFSDNSAIDASRFTAVSIGPGLSSVTLMLAYFFAQPAAALKLLESGLLPTKKAVPELGSPCYHQDPRHGFAVGSAYASFCPELGPFEVHNAKMKKESMWQVVEPESYIVACRADWFYYCRLFGDQGYSKPWPSYPYSSGDVARLAAQEEELRVKEESAQAAKLQKFAGPAEGEGGSSGGFSLAPGAPLTLEPARRVLQARIRSISPTKDDLLREGYATRDWLIQHASTALAAS
mmetsp:Transcript_101609/g.287913  ORF Transcript_101609/g.287913 Transcript_101609/m.287913 type:complete len:708 (-) Transcript_101609:528-2651(-)